MLGFMRRCRLFVASAAHDLLQLPFEILGMLPILEFLPGLVIKMALAFDIGVLETVGPSADLPGTGFGLGLEI